MVSTPAAVSVRTEVSRRRPSSLAPRMAPRSRRVSLRTAAYILAIGRVGKATVLRGI